VDYTAVSQAAQAAGFAARGGFRPVVEDAVPELAGSPPAAVVLLGFTPDTGWGAFAEARTHSRAGLSLDEYTLQAVSLLARSLDAFALFPFEGPPWQPFQRWARRAEPVHVSPLGLLIHPCYGLWHSYRAALLFTRPLAALPPVPTRPSPCTDCPRPCLAACPVRAYCGDGLDAGRCRAHLAGASGAACFDAGCLARAACPVGREPGYPGDQRRFHLEAFCSGR
jgi:hypothetical protein